MTIRTLAFALLPALALTWGASASQHLVAPGDNWQQLEKRLKPGDEIILMPGRHRAAVLRSPTGTGVQPIVIRGLSRERPAIVAGGGEGIRLEGPRHVIIRDLTVRGAKINGITIGPPPDTGDEEAPWSAQVAIRNVTITHTGPTGQRHGIQVSRVAKVRVEQCTIRGWGGAGIDVVNAAEVQVADCTLEGLPDHSQRSGIQVRAGSERVTIKDCTLIDTGPFSIQVGGRDDPTLRLSTDEAVTPPPRRNQDEAHLAARVRVMRCVIRGSACPVHFFSATDCSVRNVTIVRPRQWVVAIDMAEAGESLLPSRRLAFGSNLIVWEPGDLKRLMYAGPSYTPPAIVIEQNLWWSSEDPDVRAAWGGMPETPAFPQIVDVDPQLGEDLRPGAPQAELFGAYSP